MHMPTIIFDTDMETDCDDIGALCLLHNFQTAGLCEILAVIGDAQSDYIAPTAEAVNAWYRRPGIPVGTVHIRNYETDPTYDSYRGGMEQFEHNFPSRLYNRAIPRNTPYEHKTTKDYPDATSVYRRVLAAAPNGGVDICVVGFMTALAALLRSPADEIDSRTGRRLVADKVRKVVSMAVISPYPGRGDGKFNFLCDMPAAQLVVRELPVPLYVSSYGTSITTGERLMTEASEDHPGRRGYELYLDRNLLTPPVRNRSSWDQVATLFSILGPDPYFEVKTGLTLTVDGDVFAWRPTTNGRADGFIVPRSEKQLEDVIERWMISPDSFDAMHPI